jgi:hypothetical protein
MKDVVFILIVILLMTSDANAATNEYEGCLAYNKPVTLTGTVLVRKINYGKSDMGPPEGSVPFPLLVLDQPICTAPLLDDKQEITDEAEFLQWTLHVADSCARAWPAVARVKVTGTLYHAHNWHHHTQVLILAKQIARLDGTLPACAKESSR